MPLAVSLTDAGERRQLEWALKTLDGASEKLEKLVAMKSRADLLAKLAQMDSRELRIILLACVLQQQREHGRTGH